MNARTLGDRVLVKQVALKETSRSGLFLATPADEKTVRGEVVCVGNGRITYTGERIPVAVKEGETVIFGKFAGQEVVIDHDTYLVVREDDILTVLA